MRKETGNGWQVILGDCLDVMPTLPDRSVDAVVTDPPYGSDDTHARHLSTVADRQALHFDGIAENECVSLAQEFIRIAKTWAIFTCEWHFMEALHRAGVLVQFGIWRKRNGAPQFTGDRPGTGWEAIAICHRSGKKRWNGGGRHAVWDIPRVHGNHPCEKPLELMRAFVLDFTGAGATVLDPFMGSGTTGVACIQTGRKFIGIEIDEHYFNIAVKRLREAEMQPKLSFDEEKYVQRGLL